MAQLDQLSRGLETSRMEVSPEANVSDQLVDRLWGQLVFFFRLPSRITVLACFATLLRDNLAADHPVD